jgi:hypothetical protein
VKTERNPNNINVLVTVDKTIKITLFVGLYDSIDRIKQLVSQKLGIIDYEKCVLSYAGKSLSGEFRVHQHSGFALLSFLNQSEVKEKTIRMASKSSCGW